MLNKQVYLSLTFVTLKQTGRIVKKNTSLTKISCQSVRIHVTHSCVSMAHDMSTQKNTCNTLMCQYGKWYVHMTECMWHANASVWHVICPHKRMHVTHSCVSMAYDMSTWHNACDMPMC